MSKRCGTGGLVRKAHNLKVAGSSPVIALFIFFSIIKKIQHDFFSIKFDFIHNTQYNDTKILELFSVKYSIQ